MYETYENDFVFKVSESRYNQCGVTPLFPTGQNLLKKKVLRKYKY